MDYKKFKDKPMENLYGMYEEVMNPKPAPRPNIAPQINMRGLRQAIKRGNPVKPNIQKGSTPEGM